MPLLSEKQRAALPHFVFKGVDRSLLYAHVLSPLAQFLVDRFTPLWLACVAARSARVQARVARAETRGA